MQLLEWGAYYVAEGQFSEEEAQNWVEACLAQPDPSGFAPEPLPASQEEAALQPYSTLQAPFPPSLLPPLSSCPTRTCFKFEPQNTDDSGSQEYHLRLGRLDPCRRIAKDGRSIMFALSFKALSLSLSTAVCQQVGEAEFGTPAEYQEGVQEPAVTSQQEAEASAAGNHIYEPVEGAEHVNGAASGEEGDAKEKLRQMLEAQKAQDPNFAKLTGRSLLQLLHLQCIEC